MTLRLHIHSPSKRFNGILERCDQRSKERIEKVHLLKMHTMWKMGAAEMGLTTRRSGLGALDPALSGGRLASLSFVKVSKSQLPVSRCNLLGKTMK